MYRQTDKRVSIEKTIDGEKVNVMRKWGCLYASLLYIVEASMDREFSSSQVKLLYEYLVKINAIRRDMYIKNHKKVIENGCRVLGYEPKEVKYLAKVDYENNNNETWGSNKNSTHMLIEERINDHVVHFRHEDWNPFPDLRGKPVSHRYYRIVV